MLCVTEEAVQADAQRGLQLTRLVHDINTRIEHLLMDRPGHRPGSSRPHNTSGGLVRGGQSSHSGTGSSLQDYVTVMKPLQVNHNYPCIVATACCSCPGATSKDVLAVFHTAVSKLPHIHPSRGPYSDALYSHNCVIITQFAHTHTLCSLCSLSVGFNQAPQGQLMLASSNDVSSLLSASHHSLPVPLLQMGQVGGLLANHKYKAQATKEPSMLKARTLRVAKEIAGLERLLPLTDSSGVFVRVDEQNVNVWRALIIGPEDTPYSGGCFVFDFYFPPEYPNCPPQVWVSSGCAMVWCFYLVPLLFLFTGFAGETHSWCFKSRITFSPQCPGHAADICVGLNSQVTLLTTGGGTVRFNPNLYNCGKVCLSLLGTWSAGQGEAWNPDVSTALQVTTVPLQCLSVSRSTASSLPTCTAINMLLPSVCD